MSSRPTCDTNPAPALEQQGMVNPSEGPLDFANVNVVVEGNLRLRKVCKQHFRGHLSSTKGCEEAIRRGDVEVNGVVKVDSATIVSAGDVVQLRIDSGAIAERTDKLEVRVLCEDNHLAVVWKDSGVVADMRGHCTLALALPYCLAASNATDALPSPRIVNRLCRSVSGLVLVAKTHSSLEALQRNALQGHMCATYRVVIQGLPSGCCSPGTRVRFPALDDTHEHVSARSEGDGTPVRDGSPVRASGGEDARRTAKVEGVVVEVTRSNAARYLTTLDLECPDVTQALLRSRLHQHGLSIVGAGNANADAGAKSYKSCRGLFVALIRLRYPHPHTGTLSDVQVAEPNKFVGLRQREATAYLRKRQALALACPVGSGARPPGAACAEPEDFLLHALPPAPGQVSTADTANRRRNKESFETRWKLPEFGCTRPPSFRSSDGSVLAVGYSRVLYGDHGPYVEFGAEHVWLQNWTLNTSKQHPNRYYDKWYSPDGHSVLYDQRRPVTDQPNPPPGPCSVNNNRPDGYADYRPGRYYLELSVDVTVSSE